MRFVFRSCRNGTQEAGQAVAGWLEGVVVGVEVGK